MQQCYTFSLPCYIENSLIFNDMLFVHALSIDLTYLSSLHEITAGYPPLSGAISHYVRIPFLPVTMTGRVSNFNSTSYTEDWHKLRTQVVLCTGSYYLCTSFCLMQQKEQGDIISL